MLASSAEMRALREAAEASGERLSVYLRRVALEYAERMGYRVER